MDLDYFKSQIQDELDGAKDYAIKADDYKESHSEWCKYFTEMSKQELGHAEKLMDMLEGCVDEMSNLLQESKDSYQEIISQLR